MLPARSFVLVVTSEFGAPLNAAATRQHIIEAADELFYKQGFEATSFADIASKVSLSRGNFYYHFRTKDEILDAVIGRRKAKTDVMLREWEAGDTPVDRIQGFIDLLLVNQDKIMSYGCPVGTLCNELSKLDHVSKEQAADIILQFRTWLAREFAALGRRDDADQLALHILMRSQGVATLATAFRDDDFIRREVAAMSEWLAVQASATTSRPENQ
jgi:TetR/AcrR family transcriptional regulator, transcriptional repressor for nem operon